MSQYGQRYDPAAPYDKAQERRDTRNSARDMACGRGWVTIQFLYCDWRRPATRQRACATWLATWLVRAATRPSTATIRPSASHDTTLCARPGRIARAACTQLGFHGCVHCALDPVLTECIVLSHCLDHCS